VTQDIGKRKREETKSCKSTFPASDTVSTSDSGIITKPNCLTKRQKATTDTYASPEELWHLFYSAVSPQYRDPSNLERVGKLCAAKGVESEGTITAFQQWVMCQNAVPSPSTDCVLVLVKFNVFRALINNGKELGFTTAGEYLDDDALSPFVKPMRPEKSLLLLPPALRPTESQCQTPHHPWLDLLPDPVMRDNIIRSSGSFDEEDLCADLIGLYSASAGRNGLIIWGEPWDPSGWEVTKPFLQNWAWALSGCEELLRATNYWRQRRGEPSLKFDGLVRNKAGCQPQPMG
jgi:hypothetical protein